MDSVPPTRAHSKLSLLISSNPSASEFIPDAHAILTVYAGTSFGTPLRREICRAGFGPPPAWRALPKMVSSTCLGRTPARSIAALAATTPMSAAVMDARDPPNLPMGVRTADIMYTSCMGTLPIVSLVSLTFAYQRSHARPKALDWCFDEFYLRH